MLWWIFLATSTTSLVALSGALTLVFREQALKGVLSTLVAFSAGTLLGVSFLHLLPEAVLDNQNLWPFLWLLLGFSVMFLLEQTISWHHCNHQIEQTRKPVTYMLLLADGVHNFIDGLAIGSAFVVSIEAGIATWIASMAHEFPQELGEYAVLVHGGWEKKRALYFNFISALTIIPGGFVAFFLAASLNISFLLPFAAGTFIYIAASDLIPEVKHVQVLSWGIRHFFAFVAGILVMFLVDVALG